MPVAASQTIARYRLSNRRPGIEIHLSIGKSGVVICQVCHRSAENSPVDDVVDDPVLCSVVVSRDHSRANRRALRPAELTEVDGILRGRDSGTRPTLTGAGRFGMAPYVLRVVLEPPRKEATRPSVEAGLLHRVPLDLPQRSFGCCATADATLAEAPPRCRGRRALDGLPGYLAAVVLPTSSSASQSSR